MKEIGTDVATLRTHSVKVDFTAIISRNSTLGLTRHTLIGARGSWKTYGESTRLVDLESHMILVFLARILSKIYATSGRSISHYEENTGAGNEGHRVQLLLAN